MDAWYVVGVALLAFLAGYGTHALSTVARHPHVPPTVAPAAQFVPVPFPFLPQTTPPPMYSAELRDADGQHVTVNVQQRRHRIVYNGRAWEHRGQSGGTWVYEPVDAETPRQSFRRAVES
jgi:hypothetical protein